MSAGCPKNMVAFLSLRCWRSSRSRRKFHRTILSTESAQERKRLYHTLYERVHVLKRRDSEAATHARDNITRIILTFRAELERKSILDVGCGNGSFLIKVSRLIPHGELCGLDTSQIRTNAELPFHFFQGDITEFSLGRPFDIVFSHQVLEHIAPSDVARHLESIRAALLDHGKLILHMPNRLWGPHDITRILDNTFSGRIPALGSHVNESTYSEIVPHLQKAGFTNIRTVLPLASYFPLIRSLRVTPTINYALEWTEALRWLTNLIRNSQTADLQKPDHFGM